MKIVIEIDEEDWKDINDIHFIREDLKFKIGKVIMKGTPLSKTIDSLKELSKDHRHNFVGNSCEERAWRLGIEDSIDLILAESEVNADAEGSESE